MGKMPAIYGRTPVQDRSSKHLARFDTPTPVIAQKSGRKFGALQSRPPQFEVSPEAIDQTPDYTPEAW